MLNTSRKSPSHSSRAGHPVRVCIIHASIGGLQSTLNWLCDPVNRVSAHYVISKAGTLYQLVPETLAAWHAGDALWQGETAINECSIGIELINSTGMRNFIGQDPYPEVQIARLVDLALNLKSRYPGIAFARHLDVAIPKGRKSDPAGFAWMAFKERLTPPPPRPDIWDAWGPIGRPMGVVETYAVPRAWLVNKKLGACVTPETFHPSGLYSVATFKHGIILFLKGRKTTIIEMF